MSGLSSEELLMLIGCGSFIVVVLVLAWVVEKNDEWEKYDDE